MIKSASRGSLELSPMASNDKAKLLSDTEGAPDPDAVIVAPASGASAPPAEQKRPKPQIGGGNVEPIRNKKGKNDELVYSRPPDSATFVMLNSTESTIDGFRRLDKELVCDKEGTAAVAFIRHSVRGNEIGLGSKNQQAYFFGPGSYRRIGVGVEFETTVAIGRTDKEVIIQHMGVTYVDLPQGYAAVIQQGAEQHILGSGRYVMRPPTRLMGTVNLTALKNRCMAKCTTEQAIVDKVTGKVIDQLFEKSVESGTWEKVGSFTFIRPSPGFCYVTQNQEGQYTVGMEFAVAKAGVTFSGFLDCQMYSRTTRPFKFKAADFQDVVMKVQISWRLVDGVTWMVSKGAYEDVFDALEERAQATFRDAVGALKHEEVLAQKREGFTGIEDEVKPRLEGYAQRLGGELLDVQIREIQFPLFEEQAAKLAIQEAVSKQQKREAEIQIELQKLADQKATVTKQAEYDRKTAEAKAQAQQEELQRQRELAKEQARVELLKASVKAESAGKQAKLEAEAAEERTRADINLAKAKALAEIHALEAKARGEVEIEELRAAAEADAQSKLIEADAEAKAIKLRSEAEQQAAKARAEAEMALLQAKARMYKDDERLFQMDMARLTAETQLKQTQAFAGALAKNTNVMIPAELQQQLLPLLLGFGPSRAALLSKAAAEHGKSK